MGLSSAVAMIFSASRPFSWLNQFYVAITNCIYSQHNQMTNPLVSERRRKQQGFTTYRKKSPVQCESIQSDILLVDRDITRCFACCFFILVHFFFVIVVALEKEKYKQLAIVGILIFAHRTTPVLFIEALAAVYKAESQS